MNQEAREKMNICPKCYKSTLRFMVTQIVSAPMSMCHNLTRANMRKKEFQHWGTCWDTMDIMCSDGSCGYTFLHDRKKKHG